MPDYLLRRSDGAHSIASSPLPLDISALSGDGLYFPSVMSAAAANQVVIAPPDVTLEAVKNDSGLPSSGGSHTIDFTDMARPPETGDLVLLCVATSGSTRRSTDMSSLGWFEIGGDELFKKDTQSLTMKVWGKFMGGSPDAGVGIALNHGSSERSLAAVRVYSGVNPNIDLTALQAADASGGAVQVDPAAVTATDRSRVVAFGAIAHLEATPPVLTSPDLENFSGNAQGRGPNILSAALYSGDLPGEAGAVDPAAWSGAPLVAGNASGSRTIVLPAA